MFSLCANWACQAILSSQWAVASGGVRVFNGDVINSLRIPDEVINSVTADEFQELQRRERLYRDDLRSPEVEGKTVIIVDD